MSAAPIDKTKFGEAKFAFLEAVADDAALPKIASKLAIKLTTKYMRAEHGGVAWPAIRSLCSDLSISADSAIRKALAAMVAGGHLVAEAVPGASTRYRIADRYFRPRLKIEGASNPTPLQNEATPPVSFEADTPLQNEATSTGQINPDIETRILKPGQDSPPFPLGSENPVAFALFETPPNPSPGRKRERSREAQGAFESEFEKFWSAYPKRVDRGGAERAYQRAIKAGASHEELRLGAMRYAAERDHEPDPAKRRKYTAQAESWLNGKRWLDEPAPSPAPSLSAIMGHVIDHEMTRRGVGKNARRVLEEMGADFE